MFPGLRQFNDPVLPTMFLSHSDSDTDDDRLESDDLPDHANSMGHGDTMSSLGLQCQNSNFIDPRLMENASGWNFSETAPVNNPEADPNFSHDEKKRKAKIRKAEHRFRTKCIRAAVSTLINEIDREILESSDFTQKQVLSAKGTQYRQLLNAKNFSNALYELSSTSTEIAAIRNANLPKEIHINKSDKIHSKSAMPKPDRPGKSKRSTAEKREINRLAQQNFKLRRAGKIAEMEMQIPILKEEIEQLNSTIQFVKDVELEGLRSRNTLLNEMLKNATAPQLIQSLRPGCPY
jgi:hypothetical protein